MNQAERPNFYVILELDSSIFDWTTIQKTLLNKRRVWSMQKNQGSLSNRRKAEQYLKLIPVMEAYLKETENCKKEAKQAEQQQQQEKRVQFEKLDQLIDMLHTETVSLDDVKLLLKQTKPVFSQPEIEARLLAKGIRLKDKKAENKTKSSRPKLEKTTVKVIRERLDTLKSDNLYDFLNLDHSPKLSPRSSTKSLYERADIIYKEISRSGKIDATATVKKELAGDAQSVFKNENEKQRYDNSYASEALVEINAKLEIAGRDKILDEKEIDALVIAAKQLGVNEELALEYIEDFAAKRKWVVQQGSDSISQKRRICGYCSMVAKSANEKRCSQCGEELIQACPKCGHPTPTEYGACQKCGCHTGDGPLVKSLLKEAKSKASQGLLDEALNYCNQALHYWEDWQPVLDEKQSISKLGKIKARDYDQINHLIKYLRLIAAEELLDKFIRQYGTAEVGNLIKTISEGLSQAKKFYDVAQRLRQSNQAEKAFENYETALAYCTDYQPALSAMENSPPPSPEQLNANWFGDTLRLSWSAVKAKGNVSYRIIRKIAGLPSDEQDGEKIADTKHLTVDDTHTVSGVDYYYALYSVRYDAFCHQPATTGPYIKVMDVTKLEYIVGDSQIIINWLPPNGCLEVEVWRCQGRVPNKPGDGEKCPVAGNHLMDSKLRNGVSYGYLFIATFNNPAKPTVLLYSKGKTLQAKPVELPKPVMDLTVQRKDRTVFLHCSPPINAQLQIRCAKVIPKVTVGQSIAFKTIEQYGRLIATSRNGQAQTTISEQGKIYFVPLTIREEVVVVGQPVTITSIEGVTNLKSQCNGSVIHLTWDWPKTAVATLVTYQYDDYPQTPQQTNAVKISVSRSEYDCNKGWEMHCSAKKKHYFNLFVHDPDGDIYAPGITILETMGQTSTIKYSIGLQKPFFSKHPEAAWLSFSSSEGLPLDDILIVLKDRAPPLTKDDGIVIIEQQRLSFNLGQAKIPIPSQYLTTKSYIKVFFKDPEQAKHTRLQPAAKEKLRIG